jgi:hypothetical protein
MQRLSPLPAVTRSLVTGLVQLGLGLAGLAWFVRAWPSWLQDGSLTAWWALALSLFCLGLAAVNAGLPFIERLLERPLQGQALEHRLSPEFDRMESLSIPVLGLAFALPALPLWFIVWAAPDGSVQRFAAAGLALLASLLAVLLLAIGLRQAYILLSGLSLQVEIETLHLLPGQSAAACLRARRGRLPVEKIAVYLACRQRGPSGSQQAQPVTSYEELLFQAADVLLVEPAWERRFQINIPLDALHSHLSESGAMRSWEIQVHARLGGLPDYVEKFAFIVLPVEQFEEEEAHEEPGELD